MPHTLTIEDEMFEECAEIARKRDVNPGEIIHIAFRHFAVMERMKFAILDHVAFRGWAKEHLGYPVRVYCAVVMADPEPNADDTLTVFFPREFKTMSIPTQFLKLDE